MFNYKNKQTAGALLGEGGYGCVFRPNLRCEEGQFSEKDSRFISKLVDSENEYEEYDNFETILGRTFDYRGSLSYISNSLDKTRE